MQQGFQELSKEEREEMVQRRMDDMRRKNEELLKRYAEIEADKKNADLFSSSAIKESPKKPLPAQEHDEHQRMMRPAERPSVLQTAGQPKPLRRPHTTPTERTPKVEPEERRSNQVQHEDRRIQRLSADDHPPPDPGFRFLADRMREQDEEDGGVNGPRVGGEPRGRSQRNRRNYGGRDFENVGPTMRHQRDMEREYPESPPRNLAMQMTGRQRREYEQWKSDRERIDQERLQRHMTASGEFKREWDHNKEEQEDLPPQPGRKFGDQGHSYGSRVFSRGGRRGRGNGLSRGPRRGGRQETARDRTESSSSARSDLSSESEVFRDRPRSNRHTVPTRENAPSMPAHTFDAAGEQRTIVRNYDHHGDYEHGSYDHRNYNRGPDQRNYNPSSDGRSHDFGDFERRGRGRGRSSWEDRGKPRERRGRDWGSRGGRGGPRGRAMGSRGPQPRRRGGERRGMGRSFLDQRQAEGDENIMRRSHVKLTERPAEAVQTATVANACYEDWDASGQGGAEWGEEEGKGDMRQDSHDEGWEDAPSHPHSDDVDDDNVEDEDEAFEPSHEDLALAEHGEETELATDDSVQEDGHEVCAEVDVKDVDSGESAEKSFEENVHGDEDGDDFKDGTVSVESERKQNEGNDTAVLESRAVSVADHSLTTAAISEDVVPSPGSERQDTFDSLHVDAGAPNAEVAEEGENQAEHTDSQQNESAAVLELHSEVEGKCPSPTTAEEGNVVNHDEVSKDSADGVKEVAEERKMASEDTCVGTEDSRTETSADSSPD